MKKKILDDSAVFSCDKGIGVTFRAWSGQRIAKGKSRYFLTSKTKCKINVPGQCKCQPNPSGEGFLPCSQVVIPSTAWQGTDKVIKIDGAPALTEDAGAICPLGGKISLQNPCNTLFNSGCSLSISGIILEKAGSENGSMDKKADLQGSIPIAKDHSEKSRGDLNAKYAKCPYEKCEEKDTCPYFNSQAGVDNNSSKLKANFERDRKGEDGAYKRQHREARAMYPEYGWGYEGHHIISGNQVFMAIEKDTKNLRYGHLLMLADMCGYDINNAGNCILLPSMARREGPWGTLELFEKEAKAFDVMDIMKRQWHLSGHDYTVPKDSLKYYKPSDAQVLSSGVSVYFPDYATSVRANLDNINMKYSRKRCWKKLNSQEFRDKFKKDMDQISWKIEDSLMKFSKRPKDCYPYFVSKVAVDYAYDAPKTGKIILIYKRGKDIYASKFRVSRKQKDHYQVIVTQNTELPEMKMEHERLQEFVRYCENIMHFWVDSEIANALPWKCDGEYINSRAIDGRNVYRFACDNATELFTFIDKNEIPNQGQIARIRKRWKEVKENVAICS